MVNSEEFIGRLEKILAYYNHTASSFADKIGVQRSSISHLLTGRNKPSLEFVMKVLQKYPEVELYWLLNGKGNFPSEKNETPTPIKKDEIPVPMDPSVDISKIKADISDDSIERIVIFYKNGGFKVYEN
jgi:transcriptional regulator with XRE-family HTH domain